MEQLTKMWFPEGYTCQYKKKVMAVANMLGRKKPGLEPGCKGSYQWDDPEYVILEPGLDDDMADVALALGYFTRKTAAQVAQAMGKSEEFCQAQLLRLAEYGVAFVNIIDGVDTFWTPESWIPGTMEIIVNNLENVKRYPVVAYAMEAYGRVRGPKSAGAFRPGVGLMRVIPIESAIDGNSRRVSYEEVSTYLNENTIFSCSPCSCRTDREAMGEGCGHLKEDMCIQMGHAAAYYIRTGRAREITREEAFAIIRRAEDNGLMHQIPNIDGSGKTHAICNCCGCGCLSLRTGSMYKNTDMIRSNYVAQVEADKCVACGQCVENCPMNALRMGQKLCAKEPVVSDITTKITPRDHDWQPERWDPDYRENRKNVVDSGTAPCKTNCPAHIGIQGYIKLASLGKYREALELIKQENPFPAVCGRVCNRRCEQACTRGDVDEPIAIDEIKKYIAQQDLKAEQRFVPTVTNPQGKPYPQKIAIIGAGPAGLTCAYYLACKGYTPTVFEKEEKLGGMMMLGIPAFRLEKDVVQAEIDVLKEIGVEFRTGVEIGRDVTLDQLRQEGYQAFFLAVGLQGSGPLGVPGDDAVGVHPGVEFMRRVNLGQDVQLPGRVAVIGGGNIACDVARTAVRCGADSVDLYCLETEAEMPCGEEDREETRADGVTLHGGWGPTAVQTADGQVTGLCLHHCLSVKDGEGRFAPVYDEETVEFAPVDHVLYCIGNTVVWGDLLLGTQCQTGKANCLKADAFTLQTDDPDIFAGGDAVTGQKFCIDAIAAGKQAAISIHRYVHPGQSLVFGRDRLEYRELDKKNALLDIGSYDNTPRQRAPGAAETTVSFRDLRGTFTEEQLQKETARCLGCGATVVDAYMCVGCGQCTTKCKFDAIHLKREYDGEGVEFLKMKPQVVKQMVKRKAKIAVRKVKDSFAGEKS